MNVTQFCSHSLLFIACQGVFCLFQFHAFISQFTERVGTMYFLFHTYIYVAVLTLQFEVINEENIHINIG